MEGLPNVPPRAVGLLNAFEALETAIADLPPAAIPEALGRLERVRTTLLVRVFASRLERPSLVPVDDRLLRVAEAAALLGISKTEVRRLERRGLVPGIRIGRRLLFRREVLLRFAQEHERSERR